MNSLDMVCVQPLNRSTLIPREQVHRTALAEVLLTDVQQVREHAFRAGAQWARSHPTFDRAGDGRHNPLLVAETLRQLGICIPLRFYAVPPDSHFLIEELRFAVNPAAEPRARFAGSEITCEIQADQFRTGRDGQLQRVHLAVRLLAEGLEFAQAQGFAQMLSPAAYRAVRSRRPADDPAEHTALVRPDPLRIGATIEGNVLIGLDSSGGVRLAPADPYHPFFFDHFSDHTPGMVLLEAVRQAVALRIPEPRLRTVECTLTASRFTEPTPPAHIDCTIAGRTCEFAILQLGHQTATGSLRFG